MKTSVKGSANGLLVNYRALLVAMIVAIAGMIVPLEYSSQTKLARKKKSAQPTMAARSGSTAKTRTARQRKRQTDDRVTIRTGEAVAPSSYDGDVRDLPQNVTQEDRDNF